MILKRGLDGRIKAERFGTPLSYQDARSCIVHYLEAQCSDMLSNCEYRFNLPDVMGEQRAILLYFAQLCDATLLEALDHHL